MKTLITAALVAGLIAAGGRTAEAVIVVDSFNVGTNLGDPVQAMAFTPGQAPPQSDTQTNLGPTAEIIGGSRTSTVEITAYENPLAPSAIATLTIFSGLEVYSETNAVASFEIVYDGAGFCAGGIDLTEGGSNTGFLFKNSSVNFNGMTMPPSVFDLTVEVTDIALNVITLTQSFNQPGFFFQDIFLSFVGNPNVSVLTQAAKIRITGTGNGSFSGFDTRGGIFVTTPEPASIALLGLGGLALAGGAIRRRRARQAA